MDLTLRARGWSKQWEEENRESWESRWYEAVKSTNHRINQNNDVAWAR